MSGIRNGIIRHSPLRGNDGTPESDFDDAPIIQWSVLSADSGILQATVIKGN
jgi:hypothetical protein